MKKLKLITTILMVLLFDNANAQVIFKDINQGEFSSQPSILHQTPDGIYFVATDPASGQELWFSDGTTQNTYRLADINPGPNGTIFYQPFIDTGYILLFVSYGNKSMIWQTNGTQAGTFLRKNLKGDRPYVSMNQFVKFKNQYYYQDYDSINGYELWVTDLEWENPRQLLTLSPTTESKLMGLCVINNKLYFRAYDTVINNKNYYAFYESDGTDIGTHKLPIPLEINYVSFWHNDSCLFYITKLGNEQTAVYKYNAITKENEKVFLKEEETIQNNINFQYKDKIYIQTRNTSTNFNSMWVCDMTDNKFSKFALSDTDINSFNFEIMYKSGPNELIGIWSNKYGGEYWKMNTDGLGATILKDINPGTNNSYSFTNPAYKGNKYYFIARNAQLGYDIWVTDGTETGTKLVYDFSPQIQIDNIFWIDGKFLIFGYFNSLFGYEIYEIDITSNITHPKSAQTNIYPNPVKAGNTLKIDHIESCDYFRLYDLNGKFIELQIENGEVLIPAHIQAGLYVLTLLKDNQQITLKLKVE